MPTRSGKPFILGESIPSASSQQSRNSQSPSRDSSPTKTSRPRQSRPHSRPQLSAHNVNQDEQEEHASSRAQEQLRDQLTQQSSTLQGTGGTSTSDQPAQSSETLRPPQDFTNDRRPSLTSVDTHSDSEAIRTSAGASRSRSREPSESPDPSSSPLLSVPSLHPLLPFTDTDMEETVVKSRSALPSCTRWQDYTRWREALVSLAKEQFIWQYIDPDQDEKILPPQPIPTSQSLFNKRLTELTATERLDIREAQQEYNIIEARSKTERAYYFALGSAVETSLSDEFTACFLGLTNLRQKIAALDRLHKPTDQARRLELYSEYDALKKAPSRITPGEYFTRWSTLYTQHETLPIFHDGEWEPARALRKAMAVHYEMTATARAVNLRSKDLLDVKLQDEITFWRAFCQEERILMFPALTAKQRSVNVIASATYQSSSHSSSPSNAPRTKCLCGNSHWFSNCWYLNPDRPRPSNWRPNKQTKSRIEQALQDPKIKEQVDRALQQDKDRQDKQASKQQEDVQVSVPVYTNASAASQDDVTTSPLFSKVILDNGSDCHIVNQAMESNGRLTNRRQPPKNAVVWSGTSRMKPTAVVDALVYVHADGRRTQMTLRDAWLVPDFVTSAVSQTRIRSKGLHQDDSTQGRENSIFRIIKNKRVYMADCDVVHGHLIFEHLALTEVKASQSGLPGPGSDQRIDQSELAPKSETGLALSTLQNLPEQEIDDALMSNHEESSMDGQSESQQSPNASHEQNHQITAASSTSKQVSHSPSVWHKLLGHPSVKAIEKLPSASPIDLADGPQLSTLECDYCRLSKAKSSISRSTVTNREALTINESKHMSTVSWDLIELSLALTGELFLSHFYYDHESYHVVYPVYKKNAAVSQFDAHFKRMKTLFSANTLFFRSDNEQSIGAQGNKILQQHGLTRLTSAPETPAQNGAAEASGKVVITTARTLRLAANLPTNLWPWLARTAAYLLNRTPTAKLDWRTPLECVTGKQPSLSHLRQIGTKAFVLRRDLSRRDKLEQRAHLGSLLGYEGTNIFVIWIPSLNRVIRTRDVTFKDVLNKAPTDEPSLPEVLTKQAVNKLITEIDIPIEHTVANNAFEAATAPLWKVDEAYQLPTPSPTPSRDATPQIYSSDVSRSALATISAAAHQEQQQQQTHVSQLPPKPETWKDLQNHPHKEQFLQATRTEWEKVKTVGTVKEVEHYAGHSLPLKWVWDYKADNNGYLVRYKARLCVRGDLELPSAEDNYAATLAYKTFRAVMAITAVFGLETRQYDAVNAFLNAELKEPQYCQYPQGFDVSGKSLMLMRALYGLRKSPRLWYEEFTSQLELFGLQPVHGVNCLYHGRSLLVLFYVDDIIISYYPYHQQVAKSLESHLMSRFELTTKGPVHFFLGVEVTTHESITYLSQRAYIDKIAHRFHLNQDLRRAPETPLPPSAILVANTDEATLSQKREYQQLVGSIGHAAIVTRPDVALAHSTLSRFLQNPSDHHRQYAQGVIQYLFATRDLAITCEQGAQHLEEPLQFYIDASFADQPGRKSSQGLVVMLFGMPIDWKASVQKTVTTSTTEAELLALSYMGSASYWWIRLFQSISLNLNSTPAILCDNQQAVRVAVSDSDAIATKLRHVDIHQLWVRQEASAKSLAVRWIQTTDQAADGFTKPLPKQVFKRFLSLIGMRLTPSIKA